LGFAAVIGTPVMLLPTRALLQQTLWAGRSYEDSAEPLAILAGLAIGFFGGFFALLYYWLARPKTKRFALVVSILFGIAT
jgi:hypothetical protein